MTGKTHTIGGIVLGVLGLKILTVSNPVYYFTGVCLGALLPDIDHQHAPISKITYPLSAIVQRYAKHRTWTHTLLFAVSVPILFNFAGLNEWFNIGLFVGILSHLVLDLFNPTGVPLFMPITKKKFRIAKIKTGGNGEIAFSVASVLVGFLLYFPQITIMLWETMIKG